MCLECAPPLRRQRYRLKIAIDRATLGICPAWFDQDGVYEGDLTPSGHAADAITRIRLLNPRDHEMVFLVDEEMLDEVD